MSAELPHETAIRECRALADGRDWSPSADLVQRAAAFASIPEAHAERILRACTNWKGGFETAMSWEAREGLPFEVDRSFFLYAKAVKAAAVPLKAAA